MAYRDAVLAVLNMVEWDIQKGEPISQIRKQYPDVVIRDYDTHWKLVYKNNPGYSRFIPKKEVK